MLEKKTNCRTSKGIEPASKVVILGKKRTTLKTAGDYKEKITDLL